MDGRMAKRVMTGVVIGIIGLGVVVGADLASRGTEAAPTGASAAFIPVAAAHGTSSNAIPRGADGRPDLTGFWQTFGSSDWDILAHAARKPESARAPLGEIPAGLGIVVGNSIPYQSAAL